MASIELIDLEQTALLGQLIASALSSSDCRALFLKGPLGCGKTALTGMIVKNLPGNQKAEVSSPSFTICNYYPTIPPVLHCDLYRSQYDIPQEIFSFQENPKGLLIVEWAEYFPGTEMPDDFLDISFNMDNDIRLLNISAYGSAKKMLASILEQWKMRAHE